MKNLCIFIVLMLSVSMAYAQAFYISGLRIGTGALHTDVQMRAALGVPTDFFTWGDELEGGREYQYRFGPGVFDHDMFRWQADKGINDISLRSNRFTMVFPDGRTLRVGDNTNVVRTTGILQFIRTVNNEIYHNARYYRWSPGTVMGEVGNICIFTNLNGIIVGLEYSEFNYFLHSELYIPNDPVPPQFQVAVSASPSTGGTVTGGGTFPTGRQVTITATPNPGYQFVGWTGSATVNTASHTFTVNNTMNFTANFFPPQLSVWSIDFGPEGPTAVFHYSHGNHIPQEIVVEAGATEHGPFSTVWSFSPGMHPHQVEIPTQILFTSGFQNFRFVMVFQGGATAATNVVQLPFMRNLEDVVEEE
ncbi:MAG: hypothetical protein FWD02_04815 [Bacteroidales bacterium]|nr:hypothetical protein [Bacteroidales bacterium]